MAKLPSLSLEMLDGLAGLFADAYPASAPWLATPTSDPEVERVREALVMLSGSVFDRATEIADEGYDSIGALLCPSVLRPTPSATILELTPRESARVRRGAEAMTKEGYRFALAEDCHLLPVRIENAKVRGSETQGVLEFDVVATGGTSLSAAELDSLSIFVHAGTDTAARLCAALARARVVGVHEDGGAPIALAIRTPTWEPMVAEPDGPPQPAWILRDLFQLPARFALLRLEGLQALAARPTTRRLKIRAELGRSTGAFDLAPDSLRANCVVAVNLFETTTDPMVLHTLHERSALRVAGFGRGAAALFEVLDVTAVDRDRGGAPVSIPAMRRLGVHGIDPSVPWAYSIEREPETGSVGMIFTAPLSAPLVPSTFIASARILATNGGVAASLPPGAVSVRGNALDEVVEVRNLVATSWSADAPTGAERTLRVEAFAQLAGAFSPVDTLSNLLLAILPTRGVVATAVRANRRRVAAIESVQAKTCVLARDGAATRGYVLRITVDESAFEGRGEVELFARLLHGVLLRTAPLESPIRLEVKLRIANELVVIE